MVMIAEQKISSIQQEGCKKPPSYLNVLPDSIWPQNNVLNNLPRLFDTVYIPEPFIYTLSLTMIV